MWLNGRQVWMFATIASHFTADEIASMSQGKLDANTRATMINSAYRAAKFLLRNGVREDGMVNFSLAANVLPHTYQRKIISACFLCLGLGALGSLLAKEPLIPIKDHDSDSQKEGNALVYEALKMLDSIIELAHDGSKLGREACPGAPPTSPMNMSMILINIPAIPEDYYKRQETWCVEEILKHVISDKKIVLVSGYDGHPSHMNPGHAIEAGWFVLKYAKQHDRQDLIEVATNMIEW